MIIEKEFKALMGQTLNLRLQAGGAVDIAAWEQERVAVLVNLDAKNPDEYEVDFDESPYGIGISSRTFVKRPSSAANFRFTIKVPWRYSIKIESAGGGLSITGVAGDISGRTAGGELKLSDLRGALNLRTAGGNITVLDSTVSGRVETDGGRVLIKDVVGGLKGYSGGGQVIYKNITRSDGDMPPIEVNISTMGGEIKVFDAPAGADLSTMGGDISIASAARYVKARTNGGNISIDEVDGWVRAMTMSGDVSVTLAGDPEEDDRTRDVDIISMCGEVMLTVPERLSMDIDISLAQTENSTTDYEIVSDFEVDKSQSEQWVYDQGTPRKYLYATGSNAGGRNKIKINTVNGNVYLKKKPD